MPLPYDPKDCPDDDDNGGWKPKPGEYVFKVDRAELTKTGPKSKNPGEPMLKVLLLIDAGGKYDVKAFENFTFGAALWKFKTFCLAIGVPFDPPPEAFQVENKMGRAEFKTELYNGYTNLRSDKFIRRPTAEHIAEVMGDNPPPLGDDDAPF